METVRHTPHGRKSAAALFRSPDYYSFAAIERDAQLSDDGLLPAAADQRYFHAELPEMDDDALRVERERLRLAALLVKHPLRWSLERIACIDVELGGRHVR